MAALVGVDHELVQALAQQQQQATQVGTHTRTLAPPPQQQTASAWALGGEAGLRGRDMYVCVYVHK